MRFSVDPDIVAKYGEQIARNGVNLSLVNVHLAGYTDIPGNADGWLLETLPTHEKIVTEMQESLYNGFNWMGDSADELKRSAEYYRETDRSSAAELDATYPVVRRPQIEAPAAQNTHVPGETGPSQAGAGDDIAYPTQYLNPPGQPAEFTNLMAPFDAVSNLLSPSWWISAVLNDTIGVNPLDEVSRLLAGDWEAFARCALVWEDLGKATDAIAENVGYGLTWLADAWDGRAADAAVYHFAYAHDALLTHGYVLHEIHKQYIVVARGIWEFSMGAAGLIQMLLDNLIVAGVAVLAAWALSWTGVGAGLAWAVAAYECTQIIKLWGNVTKLISTTESTVNGLLGWAQQGWIKHELKPLGIAAGYNHPAVEPEPVRPPRRGE